MQLEVFGSFTRYGVFPYRQLILFSSPSRASFIFVKKEETCFAARMSHYEKQQLSEKIRVMQRIKNMWQIAGLHFNAYK